VKDHDDRFWPSAEWADRMVGVAALAFLILMCIIAWRYT